MRLADSRISGIFPLQHKGYKAGEWDLDLRASIFGVRITDRLQGPGDVGHWVVDPDSVGDIHGGQLLLRDKGDKGRSVPMWRFATPVRVTGKGPTPGDVATPGPPPARPPTASVNPFAPAGSGSSKPGNHGIGGAFVPANVSGRPPVGNTTTAPPPAAAGGDGKGKCGVYTDPFEVQPILNKLYEADKRLKAFKPALPEFNGKKLWPKFPKGAIGISLVADEEDEQVDLFHYTDPRLFAVNYAGDPGMGTQVHDLDSDFDIDPFRGAALQSLTRVVKKPLGKFNALSWQIGPSGCKDTEGGWVFDASVGGIAHISKSRGGFLDVSPSCKHKIGRDADGNPVSPAHLDIQSLFRESDTKDGPLNVTFWEEGNKQSIKVPVNFGWNPKKEKWDWWTTASIYFSPTPTSPTTPGTDGGGGKTGGGGGGGGGGGTGPGTASGGGLSQPGIPEIPDLGTVGPVTAGPGMPIPDAPPVKPQDPTPPPASDPTTTTAGAGQPKPSSDPAPKAPDPGAPDRGAPDKPGGKRKRELSKGTPKCGPEPEDANSPAWDEWEKCMRGENSFKPGTVPATGAKPIKISGHISGQVQPSSPISQATMSGTRFGDLVGLANAFGYLMTDQAMAMGQLLSKPYNYEGGQPDIRYAEFPSLLAAAKRSLENPVTGQMSSFGAQGGATRVASVPSSPAPSPTSPNPPPPGPPSPSPPPAPTNPPIPSVPSAPTAVTPAPANAGATGDPWDYTQRPSESKMRGGTAPGGWQCLPPETDMTAHDRDYEAMKGQTLSETYFGMGPGAAFYAGPADLATGRPKNSWSWAWERATGDLNFSAHYQTNDPVAAIKFDLNGQRIGMKCRTGQWGYLQHFNTSTRNWTFPDISGQVCVFSAATGEEGGATAAIIGNIGGSGPVYPNQWGWGATYYNGTTFYVPLWR